MNQHHEADTRAKPTSAERQLEAELIGKLRDLKYEVRADIRDRASIERNFREKFQTLNHVKLTDGEFQRCPGSQFKGNFSRRFVRDLLGLSID